MTTIYLRNLFRRHPDLFMLSYASMEAKINYIKGNLNRQLQKEKAFPLLLHKNYRAVIWPRGELLKAKGYKDFELSDAFGGTDEEFCKKFNIPIKALQKKLNSRTALAEKDKLWVYVSAY